MMHSAEQSVIRRAPMGWNSWDCYGAGVTEDIVRKNAEWMAENLKPYGWEYIVVDIQWSGPEAKTHDYIPFQELAMDEYGRLIPAVNRFPSAAGGQGFRPLAEYIHSLGLKFGIHIMRGIPRLAVHRNLPVYGSEYIAAQIAQASNICEWNPDMYGLNPEHPGSRAYYDSIFALYAEWGVDFIKLDDICREMPRQAGELKMISESLRSCGREMVLSISPGPALPEYAGLYRRPAICGGSPTISGTGGSFCTICLPARKDGRDIPARGTGRMPPCFRSGRFCRITIRQTAPGSPRTNR